MKYEKASRMIAFLLTLTMILSMVLPARRAVATETVTELPTESMTQTVTGEILASKESWNFADETQLAEFSLYQSAASSFTVVDGVLTPNGKNGELKALLKKQPENIKSVSVDILPGESGTIYGGLYFGASNAADAVDAISAQTILIKSDYTGWTDAPNRIDIIRGQFNNNWKNIGTTISETGNGNNLFTGGTKQALNLKLEFGQDYVFLTLSLVSNASKRVQVMYEIDSDLCDGNVGLRVLNSDTRFDNLVVETEKQLPANTRGWDFAHSEQLANFTNSRLHTQNNQLYLFTPGVEWYPSAAVLKEKLADPDNLESISVNIYRPVTGQARFYGGIYLGTTGGNLGVWAGSRRGVWTRGEITVNSSSGHLSKYTAKKTTEYSNTSFFSSRNAGTGMNLKIEFGESVFTVTLTDLVTNHVLTSTYNCAPSTLTGEIGLHADWSNLLFDDLTIKYKDTEQTTGETLSWDFSSVQQQTEFDFYYPNTTSLSISGSQLRVGNGQYASYPNEALLKETVPNIRKLSVDMYPVGTGKFFGGFYVGTTGADLGFWAGARQSSDYQRGEITVNTASGHLQPYTTQQTAELPQTEDGAYAPFFSSADTKDPVNLTLEFGESEITATLTNLGNNNVLSTTYPFNRSTLTGEIGLHTETCSVLFDNLTVEVEPLSSFSRTWDFADTNAVSNFTNYRVHTSDNRLALHSPGIEWYPSAAVLKEKLADPENLESISVDIYRYDSGRFYGGIYLGTTGGNLGVWAGSRRGVWRRGEITVNTSSGHLNKYTAKKTTEYSNQSFFSTRNVGNGMNLKIEFGESAFTVTLTDLVTNHVLTSTYNCAPSSLTGEIGLHADWSYLNFDNLTVKYKDTQEATGKTLFWDFSSIQQQTEFDFYYPNNSSIKLTNDQIRLRNPVYINYPNAAVLNEKFENLKKVSVDMAVDTSGRFIGGFYVGTTGENLGFWAGARQSSDYLRGEITVNTSSDHLQMYTTQHTAELPQTDGAYAAFFSNTDAKDPVNLTLEFGEAEITATMTNLTNGNVLTTTYPCDRSTLTGEIGLHADGSSMFFDNLTVEVACENPADQDQTVVKYLNDGHFMDDGKKWQSANSLGVAPQTFEAWVKIPENISMASSWYVVSNHDYKPSFSMYINTSGKPVLFWASEERKENSFAADVDIRNGEWTHIAFTGNLTQDTVTAYVNGEVVSTWENVGFDEINLDPSHIIAPIQRVYIGGNRYSEPSANFKGWIADVRLWDNVLSSEQIQSSMMTQYTTPKDGLLLNVPMNEKVNSQFLDLSGNENNMSVWAREMNWIEDTSEPGAYSIVVIPDQQLLTAYHPDTLNQMYQWIADNREKENIQMVLNVGDMANSSGVVSQWENCRTAFDLLPADLPFIAAPGNHDYDNNSAWNQGFGVREHLTLMNKYFPMSIFENYPTEFGALSRDQGVEDNIANTYQAFEVNGNKYLVLALEYNPRTDTHEWANKVVESHPNHQVIVMTHEYLYGSGYSGAGNWFWNQFVKQHENIIMVVCGHASSTYDPYIIRRKNVGVNGNEVHELLCDLQELDAKVEVCGVLNIFRFNADGTVCDVSTYSPHRDACLNEINQFTLNFPKQVIKCYAQVGTQFYETVTEATANANGEVVKILANCDEAITINSDVTIDLTGCTLSNVTVAEGVKLNLIDSTADYSGTKGSATVTGTVERFTANGDDKYMVIGENGVYTPHKYYVGVTHVSLDTNVTGFGYKAGFYGDAAVQAQIANIGYELWLTEDRVVTRTLDKFQNVVTLRLKNFLVEAYGEAPVNAKAVITLTDGTKLESAVNSYSMRSMIELLNDSAADFEVAQLQNVAMFIKKNPVMETWNVANILAVLQPVANVEAITVTDQSMALVDGTTATLTLNGAYQFTAQDTEQTVAYSDYAGWVADYYITMDAEAADGLYLAGNYGDYGWIAIPVESGKTYTNVPVVQTLLGTSLTYEEMVTDVVSFSCGVADTQSLNTGATVTVELRLTSPENPEEILTLNTTTLTLA